MAASSPVLALASIAASVAKGRKRSFAASAGQTSSSGCGHTTGHETRLSSASPGSGQKPSRIAEFEFEAEECVNSWPLHGSKSDGMASFYLENVGLINLTKFAIIRLKIDKLYR